jgi:hypothetical protein
MKNVSKQSLKPLESIPHEVSSQEYVFATTCIGEHMQTKEHKIEEVHEDQIDPTLKLQQLEQIWITLVLQS